MSREKEERKMAVANDYRRAWKEAQNDELESAVDELRELGKALEEKDPYFFEKGKIKDIVKQARELNAYL